MIRHAFVPFVYCLLLTSCWTLAGISAAAQDLPRAGYLGIDVEMKNAQAVVTRVDPSSAASTAGLRAGDVIARVYGQAVATRADVDRLLLRERAGGKLVLELQRGQILSVTLPPMPREQLPGITITHDVVTSRAGDRLRTIVTRPARASGRLPVIFVVGWLSCDSVEYPFGETDGFGAFLLRTAGRSGYATVRTDKPGVGDSEGPPCGQVDFARELAGYQAAFDSLARYDDFDLTRVIVTGISNGGGFAPLVARSRPVRAYVALSSWGRTWFEHMVDLERGRLARAGRSPAETNAAMHVFADFYDRFLIRKMTPGEILQQQPEWRPLWYDADDGQYGRPAAFYQQLQELNLGKTWQETVSPVLDVHGSEDTIMSRADAEAIVTSTGTERGTFVEVPGMDHLLTRRGAFAADVWQQVMTWIGARLDWKK
jgi:pimeloyl-ACP methyl ester carboxylesterase